MTPQRSLRSKGSGRSGPPYLHQHVADVFVSSLGRSVERRALALGIHLKVWVDAVDWKRSGEKRKGLVRSSARNPDSENGTEESDYVPSMRRTFFSSPCLADRYSCFG